MAKSNIEWTDYSWNPIRARNRETGKVGWFCTKIASGCAHCYAESMNLRLGNGVRYAEDQADKVELFLDEKMLQAPLHWKVPHKIFVCSMTDMFHEKVDECWQDRIVGTMALGQQHTYLILTKRPQRMKEFFTVNGTRDSIVLKNAWLGVSVANQDDADKNIPTLLQTPAAKRFVSYEPAIGPVDFSPWLMGIDWLILGGESGTQARTFNLQWARSAIAQCKQAEVACFVKQLGASIYDMPTPFLSVGVPRLKDRKGGDMGEWPEDLRVRQWPKEAR